MKRFERSVSNPSSRNGDAAKKSAREPCLEALRSQPSTETTTTVRRPFRVIKCGP